jgi:hypothetical protein
LGGNATEEAAGLREKYCDYFENVCSVSWQLETIRRGRRAEK